MLSNLDDPKDFCIKKILKKEDDDYIVGLDNEEEFNKIYHLFVEKSLN